MLHIQSKAARSTATLAFPHLVAAGNLLVVAFNTTGVVDPLTVTDTVGTTYAKVEAITGQSNNLAVYAGLAGGSGANTVTVAGGGTSWRGVAISEFSGAAAVADATATAYNGASPSTCNITTTVDDDLLYVAQAAYHSANIFSPGAGFVLAAQANGADAMAVEFQIAGAAGAYTASITVTADSTDNAPIIVAAFPPGAIALCLPVGDPLPGNQGVAYSRTFTRIGGTGPYTFAITSGSLSTGVTLDAATGTISGTPSVSGAFPITLEVTDSLAAVASQIFTVTISPTVGDLYRSGWTAYASSADISYPPAVALDGNTSTFWQASATVPPAVDFWVDMGTPQPVNYLTWRTRAFPNDPGEVELYLSDDGVDWGDPVSWGVWPYGGSSAVTSVLVFPAQTRQWVKVHIVTVAPGSGAPSCAEFNAGYDPDKIGTLSVHWDALPDGTVGSPYNYDGLRIGQGVAPYTAVVQSGALPAGLTVDDAGLISGTPSTGGTFTPTIRVTDSAATYVDVPLSLYVFKAGDPAVDATIAGLKLVWLSSFSSAPSYDGQADVYLGDAENVPGSIFNPGYSRVYLDGTDYTLQPLSASLNFAGDLSASGITVTGASIDCSGSIVWATVSGSLFGDGDNEFLFYGIYFQANYSDGTVTYSYPTTASVQLGSTGGVDNPDLAVDGTVGDGKLDTYARIWRTHFSGVGTPAYLRITGFGPFASTPLPPPPPPPPPPPVPPSLWLDLWVWRQLFSFAATDQVIALPPGYAHALKLELAARFGRQYPGHDLGRIQKQLAAAIESIDKENVTNSQAVEDLPAPEGENE